MITSRYKLAHALALVLALVAIHLSSGVGSFWHRFLYGENVKLTPRSLALNIAATALVYGGLMFLLWLSTVWSRARTSTRESVRVVMSRGRALVWTLQVAPCVIVGSFLLHLVNKAVCTWLLSAPPADQSLVTCLSESSYPLWLRLVLFAAILFQAPLLEEPLFRGILFRALLPFGSCVAIVVSGFIFAFAHMTASILIPVWFLGMAFAWVYQRTGTILAPMMLHALFNGLNLALFFIFPEAAT